MNHSQFFAHLKTDAVASVYLFEGGEEYIKQQALVRLKQKILPVGLEDMNQTELIDPTADALIAAAETLPFMGEKRLVVVRESSMLATGKKADDEEKVQILKQYLQDISPSTCLVFYQKGKADGRKAFYTALKKRQAIVDFSPMNDAECIKWVMQSLLQEKVSISPEVASQMVFTVGTDAALLKQEMGKLVSYLGERKEVKSEDIEAICTKSTECTVFEMVDAQVSGKTAKAFSLLEDMLRSGENGIGILAMLLRQYRLMYHMRKCMDEKTPSNTLASALGIPPFAVKRTQSQARNYSSAVLGDAYRFLFDLEYALKRGLTPQEGCVQNALLALEEILG